MRTLGLFFFWLFYFTSSYSQSTFEYLYSTSNNEFSAGLIEDADANIYIPVINYQYALIIKLDTEGSFLDSLSIHNQYGTSSLEYLIRMDNEHFGALGNWYTDSTAQIWYVLLDNNLDIIVDKKFSSNNWLVSDFKAVNNFRGNIVFSASYYDPEASGGNVCMYEITTEGGLVNSHFFKSPHYFNMPQALLEVENEYIYKVITTGRLDTLPSRLMCYINLVDSNFNLFSYDILHCPEINPRTSAQWTNDSVYLLAGRWRLIGSDEWDMGILKLTRQDSVLTSASFGTVDTMDCSGNIKSIDFISPNLIFFVGAKNSYTGYFQNAPSWIMINILDSNLNLKHQQFYGGDAYYFVISVLATQDSGCLISCSRYDYTSKEENYDLFILKVNKDGMLVSTPEYPAVTKNICAIYPNPGMDFFNIISSRDELIIHFFDSSGRSCGSSGLQDGNNLINTLSWPSGIYLYRIVDKKNKLIQTGKWIK